MLKLLSNLNNCIKWDVDVASTDWPLISGTDGTWASFDATGLERPAVGDPAACIFSEGNRDGSAGFSPDVAENGKLTVLAGGFRALTDQFVTSAVAGTFLKVDADGKLMAATGSANAVGYCTKGTHTYSYNYNGTAQTANVIEFVTL